MMLTKKELVQFEKHVAKLFEEGKINCPVHLSGGNEDELITIFAGIKPEDWVFTHHRNHYHYLLKGGSPEALLRELMGSENGCSRGMGRSMHYIDCNINFFATGIVAGQVAPSCGVALAMKHRYPPSTRPNVWCFLGDGAEDSGHFYEAVRFALGRDLPLMFIIEDNNLAIESTKEDRWKKPTPIIATNIIRYNYKRKVPHVGVGKHVSF